jgi:hypothetical protein
VGPKAVLDFTEKGRFLMLRGHELRPVGHKARSQSLYRLRYRCSYENEGVKIKNKEKGAIP